MSIILYLIVFIFGISCGSFLNCVIYRLKEKKSFLRGRSFCPYCCHRLGFFDLIPILSFLFLRGRCRYCGKNISLQYPLVEIATGVVFLLVFSQLSITDFNFQNLVNLSYLLIISCLLIIIFVYDLKHYIIPDKIVYSAILIVFLYQIIFNLPPARLCFQSANFYSSFLTAFLAAGFFFLIWLISRGKWMGFGDVKLSFLIGLFLGFPQVVVSLFSAFFIGAIIGLILIIFRKKNLQSQVPFGPFLVTGTFIALFWGQNLINWYLNLL